MAAPNNRPPTPNSHLINPNHNNPYAAAAAAAASSQRPTPTLFTARPLNSPSLNPNPNHTIPHGILYPVSSRVHPASVPPSTTLPTVTGVNPTVYARPTAQATTLVTNHVPQHQQHQHPFAYAGSDAQHHVRPNVLPSFAVPRTTGPSAPPPLKGVPIASHAKAQAPTHIPHPFEYLMGRDRERNSDDACIMTYDRKVRLTVGESCSLYSLCRSWVRNSAPHETHSIYGQNERILPRPLPASIADSDEVKFDEKDQEENEDAANDEDVTAVEPFTTRSLLEEHIKRAKRVRAKLTKKRLLRIRRYKQRLALLLPSTKLANNNITGKLE